MITEEQTAMLGALAHGLSNGLYHATSHLHAEDGTLLAIAGQTGRLPRSTPSG